jgi:hypothetical protein
MMMHGLANPEFKGMRDVFCDKHRITLVNKKLFGIDVNTNLT